MKVIDRIKTIVLRIWRSQALKYAVVDELTEEKARYHADYQRDQAKIRELDRNPKAMEKIARERYFMKTDDEDIFVLRENEDLSSDQTDSNEKAE